jgi:putative hydroxymethylpyrimidine transport system substrate-binding protein
MTKKIVLVILSFLFIAGQSQAAGEKLKLMLDWFPNVDHLPLYVAKEKGFFAENGIEVEIISPSDTSDALKLAASGYVDLAVSYQPQTLIAADQGIEVKVIAPLIKHPLTTLLFLEGKGIQKPQDLSGKKIGYTVPGLMDVLLDAFAKINEIKNYTPVNVGFTILPALSSGRVAAIMGPFKTYETVTIAKEGYKAEFFELEKYGIPDYEELIIIAGIKMLEKKPDAIKAFVKALEKSFAYLNAHPDDALASYLNAVPEVDKDIETSAFALTLPYFAKKIGHDPEKWQAFADFALKHGLIKNTIDVKKLFYH